MEEYSLGKAMLENPTEFLAKDGERYPQVITKEFEEQFKMVHLHNRILNIEKEQEASQNPSNERYITTPTNMASISNINESFNVWNMDIFDEDLIDKILGKIIATKVRSEANNDWGPQKALLEYKGNSMQVTYYPDSLENYGKIKNELTKRKEILQK